MDLSNKIDSPIQSHIRGVGIKRSGGTAMESATPLGLNGTGLAAYPGSPSGKNAECVCLRKASACMLGGLRRYV